MAERGAWRLLLALAALNVLGYVDRQLVAALAPVLMAELGATKLELRMSGTMSAAAKKEMAARGWSVTENVPLSFELAQAAAKK